MEIIQYNSKYKDSFIQFNTDWIIEYFGHLEKDDIETFSKIDEELQAGAMIFFAVEDDIPLATCMAKPIDEKTWEICKLGSNKNRKHNGCGNAVFEAAVKWAIDYNAKRLFILSNRMLKPAIHIYKKHGFREIQLDNYGYERGNIAFERILP